MTFRRRNKYFGDALFANLIYYLIPSVILLYMFIGLKESLIINGILLTVLIVPNILAFYSISLNKEKIIIKQSTLGVVYRRIEFKFESVEIGNYSIIFSNRNEKLELENYDGDGAFWFDFPECILIKYSEKQFILGNRRDYNSLLEQVQLVE